VSRQTPNERKKGERPKSAKVPFRRNEAKEEREKRRKGVGSRKILLRVENHLKRREKSGERGGKPGAIKPRIETNSTKGKTLWKGLRVKKGRVGKGKFHRSPVLNQSEGRGVQILKTENKGEK